MKPSVKTTGLEEKHILQEKIGARGRAGGFALALGRSSGSRTGRGSASSCLPRQAKLLPSLSPGCQGCQGIALVDLPTGCLSHPCPKLDRLEVPTRQPKAASSGKDVLSRQPTREGRQCPRLPGAKVELTLLSASDGLSPTLMSQKSALVGKSFPPLLDEAHQCNYLEKTKQALVCGQKWVYPSPCPPEKLVRAKRDQQAAKPLQARESRGTGTYLQTPREQRLEKNQVAQMRRHCSTVSGV